MVSNLSLNSFHRTYLESCIDMIKTLTIKSEVTAELMNVGLIETIPGIIIPNNKAQWKYYLNISGEYHYTDTPMYVTSLDTLETIVFNKTNLITHTATAAAYRYGSRYYYALIDKYPEYETLILSIVNPADINEAIDADDGTILAYDSRYLESQEMSLLTDLEKYIKRHIARWSVPSYRSSDSYYPAAEHAVLCLNLVPILLNLRLERCKTDEVHSFHIRQFLASHFDLDDHYDFLTLKQRLYLYRNIERLSKNFGKKEQFYELVQRILAERGIPLASYSVRHTSDLGAGMRPGIMVRMHEINGSTNTGELEYRDIDYIYNKELDIAEGNPEFLEDNSEDITRDFQNSPSNIVKTKFLESNMVDYTDAAPDKLNDIMLRELIHLVYRDKYQAYCEYKDPRSGDSNILSARDALYYLIYLAHGYAGFPITEVPEVTAHKYYLDPLPSLESLLYTADANYAKREELAKSLLLNAPKPTVIRAVSSFHERAMAIYDECVRQWHITSNTEDLYARGEAEKMILRMFGYSTFQLSETPVLYSDFLKRTNLPAYDYTSAEAEALMTSIFSAVTGFDIDSSRSVPHIQRSLIDLVKKLTSYSIQWVSTINENPIVLANRISTRTNYPETTGHTEYRENPLVDVIAVDGTTYEKVDGGDITSVDVDIKIGMHEGSICIDPVIKTDIEAVLRVSIVHPLNSPYTKAAPSGLSAYAADVPFAGYEYYVNMTQEQIKSIPNLQDCDS